MPLFRCNQQGFVKVMLQSVIEKRILTLKNMKKVALSLGAISILSVTGCGYNRECQTSGPNQNNCYKTKRVDPYNIKGNNSVYFIPAYTGAKDFPVPDMPVNTDETLEQTIRASIVLSDYAAALRKTGFMKLLDRVGPYTIFAIPNAGLETPPFPVNGSLMDVNNEALLHQLIGYSIVRGNYSPKKLQKAIQESGGTVALQTYTNQPLYVTVDPATGEFVTKNQAGQINRIWVNGIPQVNGTLYVSQGLLSVTMEPAALPSFSAPLPPIPVSTTTQQEEKTDMTPVYSTKSQKIEEHLDQQLTEPPMLMQRAN